MPKANILLHNILRHGRMKKRIKFVLFLIPVCVCLLTVRPMFSFLGKSPPEGWGFYAGTRSRPFHPFATGMVPTHSQYHNYSIASHWPCCLASPFRSQDRTNTSTLRLALSVCFTIATSGALTQLRVVVHRNNIVSFASLVVGWKSGSTFPLRPRPPP